MNLTYNSTPNVLAHDFLSLKLSIANRFFENMFCLFYFLIREPAYYMQCSIWQCNLYNKTPYHLQAVLAKLQMLPNFYPYTKALKAAKARRFAALRWPGWLDEIGLFKMVFWKVTLHQNNISHPKVLLKMIFIFTQVGYVSPGGYVKRCTHFDNILR